MFRFLGDVTNSHRKKGKARGAEKKHKKNDCTPGAESSPSQNAAKQSSIVNAPSKKLPPQMRSLDHFLDNISIETSLYTSPSKPTVQYPLRRDAPMTYDMEWESTQGSKEQGQDTLYTAELAFAQCKLGGWQSPPAIESNFTPSTESTFSSPSPSISHREEERIRDRRSDSYKVFRSGWVKHPQISTCLHTVDCDSRAFVNPRDSNLEALSTDSSEISWNYDSRAYHEKLSSTMASHDHDKMATIPGDIVAEIRSNDGEDEESVCSSVSSIYTTNPFFHDTPGSNISAWSPAASPANHVILKNEDEFINQHTYESTVCDGSTSRGTRFSGKIGSEYSVNDTAMISHDFDGQVSFSELISTCEGESLAERLAPYNSSPRKRLFGRMIHTNSSDSLSGSSSSDLSISHHAEGLESSSKPILLTPKESSLKIVTPKMKNTSMSLSNYDSMIPADSITNANVEKKVNTVEDSNSNGSSKDCADFPMIRSRFEEKSLEFGMEPPVPRRLSKQNFQVIADASCKEEAIHCIDDESHQSDSYEHQHHELDEKIVERDNQSFQKEAGIRSSSSCHEEVPFEDVNDSLMLSSRLRHYNEDITDAVEKSTKRSCVVENGTERKDEGPKVQLPTTGPEQQINLHQMNSESLEKIFHFHIESESDVSVHDQNPYYGPVDLDECLSVCDEKAEENKSKWRLQSDHSGGQMISDKAVIDQSYEKTMLSITASKRYKSSRGSRSPGSLFLSREELIRHEKSLEQHDPLEHLTGPRYNDWKGEQEADNLCFEELHQKVMALKNEPGGFQLDSKEPQQLLQQPHETATATIEGNIKLTMAESTENTTQKAPPRRRKRRVWKFFTRFLHRKDNAPTRAKSDSGKKRKNNKQEKLDRKQQKSPIRDFDKYTRISNDKDALDRDDFADLSLFPLNQLEHLTKKACHDGLQSQVLELLEWERRRQWLAEIDRERDEWCEQMRTSILKEREIERQRCLNSPGSAFCVPRRVISPELLNEQSSSNSRQMNEQTGSKVDGIIDPHKVSQEGYLYYSTPRSYLCEKSRVTPSTAATRESESLESFSINSFLHTDLSFASPESTSSLNSPKTVPTLPPCIICKAAERTHISLPCMHYSFCSECAENLRGAEIPTCPICQTEKITLSRVYT